ncbi:MAG: hypothetical protein V5B30_03530 [Candidatus Accumulibacter delftensis]
MIIFLPIPVWLMIVTLLFTGFFSGNLIIGFAFAKESVPPRLMGTAAGICNMGPLLGGMLLQPAVGWVLDRHWLGATAAGCPHLRCRRLSGRIQPAGRCLVVSLCLIPFARETYGRQPAEARIEHRQSPDGGREKPSSSRPPMPSASVAVDPHSAGASRPATRALKDRDCRNVWQDAARPRCSGNSRAPAASGSAWQATCRR